MLGFMRGFLRKLLEWFKALVRKPTRFVTQKPQHKLLNNKVPEAKLEKLKQDSLSSLVEEELFDEDVTPQSSHPSEVNISQTPLNYPPIPRRDLLVDRPFELKLERDIPSSSSPPVQREPTVARVTPPPSPSINETQHTDNRKRPYIKFPTNELEKTSNSEWNNPKILSEIHYELQFRSRKKAQTLLAHVSKRLAELQNTRQSTWPSTTARSGSKNLTGDVFKYEEGLLKHYGYRVGVNGLPENKRRQILDQIFFYPLPSVGNTSYLNEWDKPGTAKRLQKLAESIAAFTRNAKRRNMKNFAQAIRDWEADLAYLKRTYYDERFYFQWPRTGVSKK